MAWWSRASFSRASGRAALHVVLLAAPEELKGDAAANYRMLEACGCPVAREIPADGAQRHAGGGCAAGHGHQRAGHGAHAGRHSRDQPRLSAGQGGGGGYSLRHAQRFGRAGGRMRARRLHRDLHRAQSRRRCCRPIATTWANWWWAPSAARRSCTTDARLSLIEPAMFRTLLAPRPLGGHKGTFGHVLVVAGSRGKTRRGGHERAGRAARRRGPGDGGVGGERHPDDRGARAGADDRAAGGNAARHRSRSTPAGALAEGKTVIAMGPGLGRHAGDRDAGARAPSDEFDAAHGAGRRRAGGGRAPAAGGTAFAC